MKAIVLTRYGSPDVLELAEVDKPALADDCALVRVHAASINPADWYGMNTHMAKLRLASVGSSQKVVFFIAKLTRVDMEVLRELLEAGKVTPVVDRRYELSEAAEAFRYLEAGHARGKIVLTV